MTWQDLLAAVTTSTVITGALGYFLANTYSTTLEKALQARFDEKLAKMQAGFRRQEEELASLRNGPLSNLAVRHQEIDRRRLLATERVWEAAHDLNRFVMLPATMSVLDADAMILKAGKSDKEGESIKRWAQQLWDTAQLDEFPNLTSKIGLERPFVTPLVWSLLSTQRQIFTYAYGQLAMIKLGVGTNYMAKPDAMLKLATSTFPHHEEYIAKGGIPAVYNLVGELTNMILSELVACMDGTSSDEKAVAQAKKIMDAVTVAAAPPPIKPHIIP